MSNKVKFNLKNVHYAKMTATTANGTTTYTYEDPAAIPGAVSMSLSAESSNEPFYADGVVYYRAIANNGYSGDLEMALVPDAFRTDILNETLDGAKVLVEKANSAEPNKFALLFEFEGDSKCIRHVLYCCSAERPSIESSTTEGSKKPVTEKLTITADPRSDGLVKSKTGDETTTAVYESWYESVHEPTAVTEGS